LERRSKEERAVDTSAVSSHSASIDSGVEAGVKSLMNLWEDAFVAVDDPVTEQLLLTRIRSRLILCPPVVVR
jgi:hypothetical protein